MFCLQSQRTSYTRHKLDARWRYHMLLVSAAQMPLCFPTPCHCDWPIDGWLNFTLGCVESFTLLCTQLDLLWGRWHTAKKTTRRTGAPCIEKTDTESLIDADIFVAQLLPRPGVRNFYRIILFRARPKLVLKIVSIFDCGFWTVCRWLESVYNFVQLRWMEKTVI